jgi:phage terminase small subunit
MPRGRRPKPDALKALQGNPGKRPLFLEDRLSPGTPPPPITSMPDFLKHEREITIYRRVIEDYLHRRIARMADTNAYARWAVYMHRWMTAKESIDGIAYPSYQHNGKWQRLPAFKDLIDLEHLITALEDRLGLNPVARQTIIRGLSTLPVDLGGMEDDKTKQIKAAKKKNKNKSGDAATTAVEEQEKFDELEKSPIGFGRLN